MADDREERLRASDERAAKDGVPPLDRSRMAPGCEFYALCSPYMHQSWAHDLRYPLRTPR